MKKSISIFMALVIMLGIISGFNVSAYASSSEISSGDYIYSLLDNGTAKIIAYTGNEKQVSIPDKLDEITVTAIDKSAFDNCNELEILKIGSTIKIIEKPFLKKCDLLKEIIVDKNNNNYSSNNGILFNKNFTELIRCPSAESFENNSYIIPNTVKKISDYAFVNNAYITKVEITSNVKSIGTGVFEGCSSLSEAVISENGISKIGEKMFFECSSLASVSIPITVTEIDSYAFSKCPSLKEIEIPGTVTKIGMSAFSYCKSLKSIMLPNSVTTLDNYAFYNCESLSQAELGINVTQINNKTFEGCTSLRKIIVNNPACSISYKKDDKNNYEKVIDKNAVIYGYENVYDSEGKAKKSSIKKYAENYEREFIPIDSDEIPAVSNLMLTDATTDSVRISYNKMDCSGKTAYQIQLLQGWKKNNSGEIIDGKWVTILTTCYYNKILTGFSPSTEYFIRVRAFYILDDITVYSTNWSETKHFFTKPNQVTGLKTVSCSADGTQLKLSWDKISNADGYRLYKRGYNNKWWLVATIDNAEVTSYTVTGLTPNYDYGYKIRAYKGGVGNLGEFSSEHSTYANPAQTSLYTVASDKPQKLYVSWIAKHCQGYELMISTRADFKIAYGEVTKSYMINGMNQNRVTVTPQRGKTKYYVKVRSYYKKGSEYAYSAWSDIREIYVK